MNEIDTIHVSIGQYYLNHKANDYILVPIPKSCRRKMVTINVEFIVRKKP